MRKAISLFLVMLLVAAMVGCQQEAGETAYEKPTFTPGTMESERLEVEPENYRRCWDTGDGQFVEIETGYYMQGIALMMYADKTNLGAWVALCADPNCNHASHHCSATDGASEIMYKDGRLWYCSSYGTNPDRWDCNGMYLVSVAKDGTDKRWEYSFEEEDSLLSGGGSYSYSLYSDGYMVACDALQPDGNRCASLWLIDLETGPKKVFERVYPDGKYSYGSTSSFGRNRYNHALNGDLCIVSYVFAEDFEDDMSALCWFRGGEPIISDISQFSVKGGYLSGGILRCLQPGDGYYDINLETGEKTRLADAQMEQSGATILQPNCIIESTLLNPENTVQTQQMRFFDGQAWHDVALPEDLTSTPDAQFHAVALTSDRVIFRITSYIDDPERHTRIRIVEFYQMLLDGDGYNVEFMSCVEDTIHGVVGW